MKLPKLPQFLIKGNRPSEDDAFKKATATEEELDATQFEAKRGLPSIWRGADGKTHLGRDVRVVTPSEREVQALGISGDQFVCGHCQHFDLESGREEMARQHFGERLVHDYEWKMRHLGDIDTLGLCGASGGETATSYVSKACDHFKPKRRR